MATLMDFAQDGMRSRLLQIAREIKETPCHYDDYYKSYTNKYPDSGESVESIGRILRFLRKENRLATPPGMRGCFRVM